MPEAKAFHHRHSRWILQGRGIKPLPCSSVNIPTKVGALRIALKGVNTGEVLKHHSRLPTAYKQADYFFFGISLFSLFDFSHFSNGS